jgi:biopolymer transport protein ExbD
MASTQLEDDDEPISGINVTPLVDVVLVLLIIFIVTASFLLKSAIPIELPASATAEQRPQSLVAVTVSRGGEIFVNGTPGTFDDLRVAVERAAAAKGGDLRAVEAFVSADVGAQYGLFARVIDRLRLQGVTSIALDTRPEDAAR